MPYAENDGVKIYYEVDGTPGAEPMVMHHGYLADLESWRARGWVKALGDRYRLLLVDSRGHGRSDKPTDPESYEMRNRVLDVLAVMGAENVKTAHYLGYSMGGMIGYSALIYAPQRFATMSCGGMSPMLRPAGTPRPPLDWDALMKLALQNGAVKAAYDAGRIERPAMEACRVPMDEWNGAEQALRMAKMPIFMYAGTEDTPHAGCASAVALNPKARFLSLPGKNHTTAAESVDLIVPALLEHIGGVKAE
ncbi:MAG: alpha/beta fold hydrolase [Chloroflexi bacterium]|nr:MAG: alpha/beta fold hydrolase [Chloroflexota bacterium]